MTIFAPRIKMITNMINQHFQRLRVCLATFIMSAVLPLGSLATDSFITFQSGTGTLPLKDVTISLNDKEHSCVQIAANNLQSDFEQVTGVKPQLGDQDATILIGTVGANPQIDAWVKAGVLKDLKGSH